MLRLWFVILCLSALTLHAVPAASGGRPDSETLKKVQQIFRGWKLNSSGRCAVSRSNGLWAWKIVLEHPVNPRLKSSMARDGKGYIIIVMVPDAGIDPGRDFIDLFNWNTTGSDLKQYTVFLGRGSGYFWYMKSDVARLEFFRRCMKLSGGVDFDGLMAEALNVSDYELYTSRIAVEYFRGKGPNAVPHIMRSMRSWQREEKALPVQHLLALKLIQS